MSELAAAREKSGRIESFGWVTFAYVVALAVAWYEANRAWAKDVVTE